MKNRRRKRKLKKSVKITLVLLLVIGLLSYPTYKLLTKEKTTTNKTKPSIEEKEKFGGESGIRTHDTLLGRSVNRCWSVIARTYWFRKVHRRQAELCI